MGKKHKSKEREFPHAPIKISNDTKERKNAPSTSSNPPPFNKREKPSIINKSTNTTRHVTKKTSSSSYISLLLLTLGVVLLSIVVMGGVRWYMTPLLTTPLSLPPVIDYHMKNSTEYKERLWGSYRSNVYFGMRPRLPRSIIMGMAWMYALSQPNGEISLYIRHTCQHGDNLGRYGWRKHDGRSFGQQDITDSFLRVSTDFIINSSPSIGHSWTSKIRVESHSTHNASLSVLFYVFNEGGEELEYKRNKDTGAIESISGTVREIGNFNVNIFSSSTDQQYYGYLATDLNRISLLSEFLQTVLKKGRSPLLPGEQYIFDTKQTHLVLYQVHGQVPIEIEVSYSSGEQQPLVGEMFNEQLNKYSKYFDKKFESVFKLKEKGYSSEMIAFAESAFSNLIGSISYFYGHSLVKSPEMKAPKEYFSSSLFTGVPSRSFFPRGFLWDEGFHQLLVTHWDLSIVKDVLGHWMDLLNVDGWLPREQILGEEALSKVPQEFVVQLSTNANPPTFFLTVDAMLNKMEKDNEIDIPYLKRLLPRLEVWHNWFMTTQKGPKPHTFQWKGRNSTIVTELNPKTLTSGLDDYPRASHPTNDEYHIDLQCWMVLSTSVLERLTYIVNGEPSIKYKTQLSSLTNFTVLNKLHWDSKRQMYSDYGLHTSKVKLVINRDVNPPVKFRKVMTDPSLKFVNSFGYVNLFPFLMKLLPPDSVQLEATLHHIRNESLIWTDYGLRSLAINDPFYNKANTGQDKPYWRGAIWININYLTLRALHHYSNVQGPYQNMCKEIYRELRSNIVNNMYRQYQLTGFIWEQYNDRSGKGKGTHPFTGWSSLVVLIMGELY